MLGQVKKDITDITPMLAEDFDFSELVRQMANQTQHKVGLIHPAA